MNIRCIIIALCLFGILSTAGFAVAESKNEEMQQISVITYKPTRPVATEEHREIKKYTIALPPKKERKSIETIKKEIKSSSFFRHLVSYAVVRENNFALCQKTSSNKECLDEANYLLFYKNMTVGNCSEILSVSAKEICQKKTCENLPPGYKQDVCQGYSLGDIELIKKGLSSGEFCAELNQEKNNCGWNEEKTRFNLAAVQGFKNSNSKKACEKFSYGLKGYRSFICDVLFDIAPTEQTLDSIATDLAHFLAAKQYKDPSECQYIANTRIKVECLVDKIKKLEDI